MATLDYAAPASIEEATRLLASDEGARPLAGGTDLLVQIRSGRIAPKRLVDIKRIPEITGIRRKDGGFAIGAGTPCAALGEDAALSQAWPGVVEAACLIGSTQVQGRATVAGNLCNASPAADSVPAMIAARAICTVVGPAGRRLVPAEQIVAGPGQNTLGRGEFILEIALPARPARASDAYLRSIPRTEMDIAVVGAGVNLALDAEGVCSDAQVALGAVAPTAVSVPEAAGILAGSRLEDATLARLDKAVRAACRPISDKRGTAEYRTAMAVVLVRRAAAIAYRRAMEKS